MTTGGTITCKCGEVIGVEIRISNKLFLIVGTTVITEIHGVCDKCGQEFHWAVKEKILRQLMFRKDTE